MSEGILKVLVLTPIYPGEGVMKSTTPVVHYFVREWIKHNVEVRVIHFPTNFPSLFYVLSKPFERYIGNRLGSDIRTWKLKEQEYFLDDVQVYRLPLMKMKPHGRFASRTIRTAIRKVISYCENKSFKPDVLVSHWVNPQLEIMHALKKHYGIPTCFVAHDTGHDLKGIYKNEAKAFLDDIDRIGYRSESIRRCFEQCFNLSTKPHFQCYSGIPAKYVEDVKRIIHERNSLIFVGSLIRRKYPIPLLKAAVTVYGNDGFNLTFIGTGPEDRLIVDEAAQLGCSKSIHILGRVPRDIVVKNMDSHSIFVMISENETFGLVYLEAMARGCITVASRDEGFDGIIEDGVNGFLCKAGDTNELSSILRRIDSLSQEDIQRISDNAIKTAHKLTDEKVANTYLMQLKKIADKQYE